jgi:glc operon protein GlcG
MPVTLRQAQTVVAAAHAKAAELGAAVSVAVVDERGDIIALGRMDGATYPSPVIAHGKAMASAAIRRPTSAMAEIDGTSTGGLLQRLYDGQLVFIAGAVPLAGGGAVGVSGSSATEDETVATAGAGAVR